MARLILILLTVLLSLLLSVLTPAQSLSPGFSGEGIHRLAVQVPTAPGLVEGVLTDSGSFVKVKLMTPLGPEDRNVVLAIWAPDGSTALFSKFYPASDWLQAGPRYAGTDGIGGWPTIPIPPSLRGMTLTYQFAWEDISGLNLTQGRVIAL